MKSPKMILVTGYAGFIGSNFIKGFRKQFPETVIVGVDDLSSGKFEEIDKTVAFYPYSILDNKPMEYVFRKHTPEFVFHFAALPRVSYCNEHPVETTQVNIVGTVTLLELSQRYGVKRFIYSSSSSVYGNAKSLPTKESENLPNPKSPYASQKYAGEIFCKNWSEIFGVDTVSLRYFNVFGPGQYGNSAYATVISAWLEPLFFPNKTKPFIEGDGSQTRDFCYVDNVVNANILAMQYEGNLAGEVFNVGNGEQTSVNEVLQLIEEYTGKKLDLEKRPTRAGDVHDTLADISKIREVLGYEPKISFKEGLKKTIAWFESRKK